MDTACLPARLHELYPLCMVPLENTLPQEGEEDFIVLSEIADRIIQKLQSVSTNFQIFTQFFTKRVSKDYTRKYFPAQVIVTVNTLPGNNSRCCPFWTCPSGTNMSYVGLLKHLDDAHPDAFVYPIKLSESFSDVV